MEADGLERVRIDLRKRVRRERRIVVTERDGLLVEPREVYGTGPKVAQADFIARVAANPGRDSRTWAAELGVTDRTVRAYQPGRC